MAAERLIVDVSRLARDGEQCRGSVPAAVLELDAATSELFVPSGDLRYDLFVQRLGSEILARGAVSQRFRCLCTRCGAGFDWEARDGAVTVAVPAAGEEVFVDLTPDLREAILLALPAHPLCRADCRGLCARCGADLNRGPCACPPREETRWGALERLGGG